VRMRKNQKIIAIIIAGLVSLSMIVPSFALLFSDSSNSNAVYSNNGNTSTIQGLQNQVSALTQALSANPQDTTARLNLANTYYDLAMANLNGNGPEQAGSIFKQAIAEYQEVVKTQKDVNILVDMATAAFYAGEDDLADKTFREALAVQSNYLNALVNYGVFLLDAKNDYLGAIAQWDTALSMANPTAEEQERLKGFIGMAQERMQASFEQSGSINNTTTQPAEAK